LGSLQNTNIYICGLQDNSDYHDLDSGVDGMNESGIEWDTDADDETVYSDTDDGLVRWTPDRTERSKIRTVDITENRTQFRYCEDCGKRINVNAEICPYCGVRVAHTARHKKGGALSFWGGVLAGFIALIFLSWIPILGPILAGFIAGVIAGGGAGRGASAGFTSGMIGFSIVAVIALVGGSFFGIVMEDFLGIFVTLLGVFAAFALLVAGLFYGFLCLIGGAVGGLLRE